LSLSIAELADAAAKIFFLRLTYPFVIALTHSSPLIGITFGGEPDPSSRLTHPVFRRTLLGTASLPLGRFHSQANVEAEDANFQRRSGRCPNTDSNGPNAVARRAVGRCSTNGVAAAKRGMDRRGPTPVGRL
jgi:hypothetical protein